MSINTGEGLATNLSSLRRNERALFPLAGPESILRLPEQEVQECSDDIVPAWFSIAQAPHGKVGEVPQVFK